MDFEGNTSNIDIHNKSKAPMSIREEETSDFNQSCPFSTKMPSEQRRAKRRRSPVVILEDLKLPRCGYFRIHTSQLRDLKQNAKPSKIGPKSKTSPKSKILEQQNLNSKIKHSTAEDSSGYANIKSQPSRNNNKTERHVNRDLLAQSGRHHSERSLKNELPYRPEKLCHKETTGISVSGDLHLSKEKSPLPLVDPKVMGLSSILQQDGSTPQFKKFTLKKKKTLHQSHFHKVFMSDEPVRRKELNSKISSTYHEFKKKYKDVIRTSHVLTAVRKKSPATTIPSSSSAERKTAEEAKHSRQDVQSKLYCKDRLTDDGNQTQVPSQADKLSTLTLPNSQKVEPIKLQRSKFDVNSYDRVDKEIPVTLHCSDRAEENSAYTKSSKRSIERKDKAVPFMVKPTVQKAESTVTNKLDLDENQFSKLKKLNTSDAHADNFMDICFSSDGDVSGSSSALNRAPPVSAQGLQDDIDNVPKVKTETKTTGSRKDERELSDTKHIDACSNESVLQHQKCAEDNSLEKNEIKSKSEICAKEDSCSVSGVAGTAITEGSIVSETERTTDSTMVTLNMLNVDNILENDTSEQCSKNATKNGSDLDHSHVPFVTDDNSSCVVNMLQNFDNSEDIYAEAHVSESSSGETTHLEHIVNVPCATPATDGVCIIASIDHHSDNDNSATNKTQLPRGTDNEINITKLLCEEDEEDGNDKERLMPKDGAYSDHPGASNLESGRHNEPEQRTLSACDVTSDSQNDKAANATSEVPFENCSSFNKIVVPGAPEEMICATERTKTSFEVYTEKQSGASADNNETTVKSSLPSTVKVHEIKNSKPENLLHLSCHTLEVVGTDSNCDISKDIGYRGQSSDFPELGHIGNNTDSVCSTTASSQTYSSANIQTAAEGCLPAGVDQAHLNACDDKMLEEECDPEPCPPLLHQETGLLQMEASSHKLRISVEPLNQSDSGRESGMFDSPPILSKEVMPASLNLQHNEGDDKFIKGNVNGPNKLNLESVDDANDKQFSSENKASEISGEDVLCDSQTSSQTDCQLQDEKDKHIQSNEHAECDVVVPLELSRNSSELGQTDPTLNSADCENLITDKDLSCCNSPYELVDAPQSEIAQSSGDDNSSLVESVSFHGDASSYSADAYVASEISQNLSSVEKGSLVSSSNSLPSDTEERSVQSPVLDTETTDGTLCHQNNKQIHSESPTHPLALTGDNQDQCASEDVNPNEEEIPVVSHTVTGNEMDSQVTFAQVPGNENITYGFNIIQNVYSLSSAEFATCDQIAMQNAYANIASSSVTSGSPSALKSSSEPTELQPETTAEGETTPCVTSYGPDSACDSTDAQSTLYGSLSTSQMHEVAITARDTDLKQQKEISGLNTLIGCASAFEECSPQSFGFSTNYTGDVEDVNDEENLTLVSAVDGTLGIPKVESETSLSSLYKDTLMKQYGDGKDPIFGSTEEFTSASKQNENSVSGIILSVKTCETSSLVDAEAGIKSCKQSEDNEKGRNHEDISADGVKPSESNADVSTAANDLVIMQSQNNENDFILAQFEEFERMGTSIDNRDISQEEDSETGEDDRLMIDEGEPFCQETISKEAAENAVSMVITNVDEITYVNNYGFSTLHVEKENSCATELQGTSVSAKQTDKTYSEEVDNVGVLNSIAPPEVQKLSKATKSLHSLPQNLTNTGSIIPESVVDNEVENSKISKVNPLPYDGRNVGIKLCSTLFHNKTDSHSLAGDTSVSSAKMRVKKKGRPFKKRKTNKGPHQKQIILTETSAICVKRKRATKAAIRERLKEDSSVVKVFQTRAKTRALMQSEQQKGFMILPVNKKSKKGKKFINLKKEHLKLDTTDDAAGNDKSNSVSSDSLSQDEYMKSLQLKPARVCDNAGGEKKRASFKRGRPAKKKLNGKMKSKMQVLPKAYSNIEESSDEEPCEDNKEKDVLSRFLAEVESNTDELPTILPPKRRRRPLVVERMESSESERIAQEFPKHNWLENKISLLDDSKKNRRVMEGDFQRTANDKDRLDKRKTPIYDKDTVKEATNLNEKNSGDENLGHFDGHEAVQTSQRGDKPSESSCVALEPDSVSDQSEKDLAGSTDEQLSFNNTESIDRCQSQDKCTSSAHIPDERAEQEAEFTNSFEEPSDYSTKQSNTTDSEVEDGSKLPENTNQVHRDEQCQMLFDSSGSNPKSPKSSSCQTSVEEGIKSAPVMSSDTSSKAGPGKILSSRPTGVVHPSSKICAPVQMVQPQVYSMTESANQPLPPLIAQTKQSISDILTTEPVNLTVSKSQNEVELPLSLKIDPPGQGDTMTEGNTDGIPPLLTVRANESSFIDSNTPPVQSDLGSNEEASSTLSVTATTASIQSEENFLNLTMSKSNSEQSPANDVIDLTCLTSSRPEKALVANCSEGADVSGIASAESSSVGRLNSHSVPPENEDRRSVKRPSVQQPEGAEVPAKAARSDSAHSSDAEMTNQSFESAVLVKSMQRRVDLTAIDNEYQKSRQALTQLEVLLKEKERLLKEVENERDKIVKKKQDMEDKVKSLESFRNKAYSRHAHHLVENSPNLSATNNQSRQISPGSSAPAGYYHQSQQMVSESSPRTGQQGPSDFTVGPRTMKGTPFSSSLPVAQPRPPAPKTPPPLIPGRVIPTVNSQLPLRQEDPIKSSPQQVGSRSPAVSVSSIPSPLRLVQTRQNLASPVRSSPHQAPNPPPAHRNHDFSVHRELLVENGNRTSHPAKHSTVWDRPAIVFPPPENAGSVQKNPPPAHSSQPKRFYQITSSSSSGSPQVSQSHASTAGKMNYVANAQAAQSPIAGSQSSAQSLAAHHSENTRNAQSSAPVIASSSVSLQQSRPFVSPEQSSVIHHIAQAPQQAQANTQSPSHQVGPPPLYTTKSSPLTNFSQQSQVNLQIAYSIAHGSRAAMNTQSTHSNSSSAHLQAMPHIHNSCGAVPQSMAHLRQNNTGAAFTSSPSSSVSGFEENQKRGMTARPPALTGMAYRTQVAMQPQKPQPMSQEKQQPHIRSDNRVITATEMARLQMQQAQSVHQKQQQQQQQQQQLAREQFGMSQHSVSASGAHEHFIDLTRDETQQHHQMQMQSTDGRSFQTRQSEMRKSVNPEECENIIQEQLQYALAHRQKTSSYTSAENSQKLHLHKPEVYRERHGDGGGGQQVAFLPTRSTAVVGNMPQQRIMNPARAYAQSTVQVDVSAFQVSPQEMQQHQQQQQPPQRNAVFRPAFSEQRHSIPPSERPAGHVDPHMNNNAALSSHHRELQNVVLQHRRPSEGMPHPEMPHLRHHYPQTSGYNPVMPRQPHPIPPKPVQPAPAQQSVRPIGQMSGFQGNNKQAYIQAHPVSQVPVHVVHQSLQQSVHPGMPSQSGQVLQHVPAQLIQTQPGQMMPAMRHPIPRQPAPMHPQNPAVLAMMPQTEPRIQEPPMVADVSDLGVMGKECNVCNQPASFLCSKCKKAWYCSPQCQMKAWDMHSRECL